MTVFNSISRRENGVSGGKEGVGSTRSQRLIHDQWVRSFVLFI